MARRSNRRSNAFQDENPFSVLNTVRLRTQNTLRSTANSICRLPETTHVSTLRVLKEELQEKWNDFIHAFEDHEQSLSASADPSLQSITQEYGESHNKYVQAKLFVANLIDSQAPTTNDTPVPSAAATNRPASNFKMPPIRITPFNGSSTDWIEFKATCDSVLTPNIPEVHRLQCLKDALIGEPREIVTYVLPGENAYAQAMQLLQNRYANARAIVNEHLRKFYAIPSITSVGWRIPFNA